MSIVIATAIGNVTLKENYDNYRKGIDAQRGPWVSKTYWIQDGWQYTDAVANAMMGAVGATGTTTLRVPPHQCPESPNLFATSVEIIGDAVNPTMDSGRPQFHSALIQVQYTLPTWNPLPVPATVDVPQADGSSAYTYCTTSLRISSEAVQAPWGAYKYSSDGLAIKTPYTIDVAVADFVISRPYVVRLDLPLLLGKVQRLNDRTFFGQPRGQIKYVGADTRTTFSSDGTKTITLDLQFKWRERDWNQIPRPDSSAWDKVKDGGGVYRYVYTNMDKLMIDGDVDADIP